jgi:hypothetical protein
MAKRSPVLEEADIAPGAFGATPPRPAESVTTLAVMLRLVVRSPMPNYVAGEIARLLFTTKARIVSTLPQVAQIDAPDTDKGAALPVHPGAAAYFDGEQTSLLECYESYIYLGTFLISLIGSGCAWIMSKWRDAGRRQDREQRQALDKLYQRLRPGLKPLSCLTLLQQLREADLVKDVPEPIVGIARDPAVALGDVTARIDTHKLVGVVWRPS